MEVAVSTRPDCLAKQRERLVSKKKKQTGWREKRRRKRLVGKTKGIGETKGKTGWQLRQREILVGKTKGRTGW